MTVGSRILLLLVMPACSFAFVDAPRSAREPANCTSSSIAPITDFTVAAISAVGIVAAKLTGGQAELLAIPLVAIAIPYAISGSRGLRKVDGCRDAIVAAEVDREETERQRKKNVEFEAAKAEAARVEAARVARASRTRALLDVAIAAAARGDCTTVKMIAPQLAELDEEVFATLQRDAAAAACLAEE